MAKSKKSKQTLTKDEILKETGGKFLFRTIIESEIGQTNISCAKCMSLSILKGKRTISCCPNCGCATAGLVHARHVIARVYDYTVDLFEPRLNDDDFYNNIQGYGEQIGTYKRPK